MNNNTIKVVFNGRKLSAVPGTKINELLSRVPHSGDLPALGAIANKRLTGLYRSLTADAEVKTLDYNSKHGAFIYRRSVCLLLLAATKELYPNVNVEIGQSLGDGYFVELNGIRVTKTIVNKIQKTMRDYVIKDLPFIIDQVYVDEAASYYRSVNRQSKVNFLTQMPRSEIRIVTLMNFRDILHGPVAPNTGVLKNFRLDKYKQGVLLSFPIRDGSLPEPIDEKQYSLLFETVMETRDWNELVGVANVSDLNEACIHGTVSELIKVAESLHEKKIAMIADQITHRPKLPRIILVAGPSSSGKTTFSQRLGVHLRVNGISPRTLSLDNYYVDRVDTPKHPDGNYDFESVYALDLDLFNDHLKKLSKGKQIMSPIFSFTTGRRHPTKKIPIELGKREVLIIEGIHALNEMLHRSIAGPDKFQIFVSALTQLCIDEHNRIFTSDSRLIRRMVRDRLYRGYSAAQTLNGWLSVRAGEDKNIFPFQSNADVMFNTTLVYEHAVLTPYAQRFLLEVDRHDKAYTEAERLYRFLEYFIPILPSEVPPTSVLREFIGGSTFEY